MDNHMPVFLEKNEWKKVRFDDRFSVSYKLVNHCILLIQGHGYSDYEAEKRAVLFGKTIVAELIPENHNYVMIQDWTHYKNSSSKARQYFIDSVVRDTRLAGVVFCHLNWSQAMTIRMAKALNILKFRMEIQPTRNQAVDAAMAMLAPVPAKGCESSGSQDGDTVPAGQSGYVDQGYIRDLLEYLETIDWKTGRFIRNPEVNPDHPMLPVFDAVSFIKSQLDRTFDERNRIEQDLIRHRDDLESIVRERTAALEASQKQFKLLLEHSPISIAVVDHTYHLSFLNHRLTQTFGWSREEVSSPGQFAPLVIEEPENREQLFMDWADSLLGRFGHQFGPVEQAIICKDGAVRTAEITATGIGDKILILMNDISERKRAEARLEELAIRDELTGMFNRRHFMAQLGLEFDRSRRYNHPLSLLLFDVDYFKQVNDIHGHPAGDKVLATLARVTWATFRGIDSIFRIGGEEFAVILPETPLDDAVTAARRLQNAVAEKVFNIGENSLSITVSIGIAMVSGKGTVLDDFLKHVDEALYLAKNRGRNRIETYRA